MADMKRFKVTNTTVKPVKYNSQGKDVRPVRDRVGHPVQFIVDGKNGPVIVTIQSKRSAIVDDINEGILKLFRKGLIKVETIKDIADELKQFAQPGEKEAVEPAPVTAEVSEEPATKPEPQKSYDESLSVLTPESPYENQTSGGTKGHAVPMGETHDGDKLVNPDGNPNFVSKATKANLKKTRPSTWSQDKG